MTRASKMVFALVPALAAYDCPQSLVCTTHIQPGIIVTIVDSASGEPRAADAAGIAQSGSFVDSLRPLGYDGQPSVMVSRSAADERPGTYTVTIREAGYQQWQRAGVRVTRGECHVQSAQLLARLQPAP